MTDSVVQSAVFCERGQRPPTSRGVFPSSPLSSLYLFVRVVFDMPVRLISFELCRVTIDFIGEPRPAPDVVTSMEISYFVRGQNSGGA